MKTKIYTILFVTVACVGTIFAEEKAEIEGIMYNFNDYNYLATVISRGTSSGYTGDVIIPASVIYNGDTYNVVAIDQNAFKDCKSLYSVTIPNSVTHIGNSAFYGCSSLTSIQIPNTISTIGLRTFYRCTALTSITIPNSVTSIGIEAFRYCSSLISVTIDSGVADISKNAFSDCTSLVSIFWGDRLTNIENEAFSGCTSLTSITIPSSVTSIGSCAFYGCNLVKVNICDIATWCSIDFKSVLVNHAYDLYLNNNLITDLVIPDTITSIKNSAFAYCNFSSARIQTVIPPTIGTGTFYHTNYPLYVPCGKLDIYKTADVWSNYMERIQYKSLDNTISIIPSEHGQVNTPLTECDLPLVAIPDYGYHFVQWSDGNTDNPRTIELTQDTTFAAEFAPDKSGICGLDSALTWSFDDKSKTLTINGSGALTENYTFGVEAPTQMQTLVIGNNVTSIGDSAFYAMTTINHLSIGTNVASVGDYAFAECKNFDDITCYATIVPTINATTFANVGNKYYIYLFVPEDRERAYKRDTYWSQFDVQIIKGTTTTTDSLMVTSEGNTADVIWPEVTGAATYELVIKGKNGNIVCTLVFNANGQLVSIVFSAPAHDKSAETKQVAGFSFTVTGLEEGETYNLTITAKDDNDNVLDVKSMSFVAGDGEQQDIANIDVYSDKCNKIVHNGQIYILRGEKVYNLQGQEVR